LRARTRSILAISRAADRLAEARAERARIATIEDGLRHDPGLLAKTDERMRHLRLADLLAARGEAVAARGHRVRAALAADLPTTAGR
jgi:hypothetical protein